MNKLVIRLSDEVVINRVVTGEDDSPSEGYEFVNDQPGVDIGFLRQPDGGFINPNPPVPEPSEPVPNWLDFKAAFLGEPNWLVIAPLFSNPDIRTGIVAAVGTSNVADFQDNYLLAIADLTAQQIPLDPAVLASWQDIANANNIPISFALE